jgi:hypothetical protein
MEEKRFWDCWGASWLSILNWQRTDGAGEGAGEGADRLAGLIQERLRGGCRRRNIQCSSTTVRRKGD